MSWRTRYLLVGLLGLGAVAAAEAAAPPAPPLVDTFGDPLPRGAVARLGTVRWRHDGASAFAFTRTGETLVSIGSGAVQFWEVKTGKVVRSFPVENRFGGAQLSMPVAGDVIVVGASSDKVVAYDTKTGKELWRIEGAWRKWFESVAITPDGSTVAVGMGGGDGIKLLEAKTGKLLRTLDNGKKSVSHLEFSADGGTLLAVEAGRLNQWQFESSVTLHVWDVKAGKKLREWKEEGCHSAALSPDGKTVACAPMGTPRLYDVTSGKPLPKLKADPKVLTGGTFLPRTAFGPDGTLALGYSGRIELWDVKKAKLVREIRTEAYQVAFRRDGKMLAMSSGEFSLIDLETGKRAFDLPSVPGSISDLTVSGDGKLVAAVTRLEGILLWDARTGRQVGRSPVPRDVYPWYVQFLRGGTSLAGLGVRIKEEGKSDRRRDVILWSWDFRRSRELWPEESLGERPEYSFDPRGVLFAHQTESGVTVRNLTTGKLRRKIPLDKDDRGRVRRVSDLFFAPDGNTLAVGRDVDYRKRVVEVWDLKLNKVVGQVETRPFEYGRVFGFAVHGRHLLVPHKYREECRAWDLWTSNVRTMELPPNTSRSGYSPKDTVSPNGLWIARTDREVTRIIEFATGQVVLTWKGDPTPPDDCAWMPDSKRLVVALQPPLVLDLPLCADAPKAAGLSGQKRRAAIWADLESKDAAVAFRAICWLASHPDEALPLLEKHLKPVPGPDLVPIRKLVAQLDDEDFDTREDAEEKLKKVGYPAKRLLEEVVGSDKASLEQRRRARRLLAAIKVPAKVAEQLREDVAQLRAMQVLEWIDSPRAREHLKALSEGDPDVALTRYARSALALAP
jgi:WD40 repeat protein